MLETPDVTKEMSHLPRDQFCVNGQWNREVETRAFTLGDLKKNVQLK